MPKKRSQAHSWSEAKRLARQGGYGEKVVVSKPNEPRLPPEFGRSYLAIHMGANAVYRDNRPRDSYQIREYDDKWTIELDQHNPEQGNAIKHAVMDAPVYTAIAATAVGALLSGGS